MDDHEKIKISKTKIVNLQELAQVLVFIEQRNQYVSRKVPFTDGLAGNEDFILQMIDHCNQEIAKILNL